MSKVATVNKKVTPLRTAPYHTPTKAQLEAIPDDALLQEVARRMGCNISPGATATRIVPKKNRD